MGFSVRHIQGLATLCLGVGTLLFACGKDKKGDDRSEVDPALAAIEIDAATLSDVDGVVTVTIDAASPNTQIVHASEESRIKGTTLAFPPGSFDIDFEVSLEEGKSVATKANFEKLIAGETALLSSASAVVVTWTYDQDTFVPFKLTIPAPELPTDAPAGSALVILTVKNQVDQPKRLLGLTPATSATLANGFVTFESNSYGVFQAVYLSQSAVKANQVETDDKGQGIGKISGVKPGTFTILSPTKTFAGAKDILSWDSADLADSYSVKLDLTSSVCAAPYYTGSVKALSLSLANAKDGQSFACVSAVNKAGETAATNTFKFVVDRTAPAVPGKPGTNGPTTTTIEPIFTWAAVEDVGPSGVAYYQVEIGTSPGAADVFNGPVTQTSKSVIGFEGKTYYARVSAVDNAGNASEFSPVSDGVLVSP